MVLEEQKSELDVDLIKERGGWKGEGDSPEAYTWKQVGGNLMEKRAKKPELSCVRTSRRPLMVILTHFFSMFS